MCIIPASIESNQTKLRGRYRFVGFQQAPLSYLELGFQLLDQTDASSRIAGDKDAGKAAKTSILGSLNANVDDVNGKSTTATYESRIALFLSTS